MIPFSSPALATDNVATCPRLDGLSGSPSASPSMRTYLSVSSTTPYGSLATIKRSSARPILSPCPLPCSASKSLSGSAALATAIATDPSNFATVSRNASLNEAVVVKRRATNAGITFASVVIGPAMRRLFTARRSAWLSTSPFNAATKYASLCLRSSSSLFTG